jgi:hypothetical protein
MAVFSLGYYVANPLFLHRSVGYIIVSPPLPFIIVVSGPVGTHDHIFVPSETIVFRNGASSSTRGGVSLPLDTPPLLTVTRADTDSVTGSATYSVTTRLPRVLLAPCLYIVTN